MPATPGEADGALGANGAADAPLAGEVAPRVRRLGVALVVIAAAQLMVVLGATIVNVAAA